MFEFFQAIFANADSLWEQVLLVVIAFGGFLAALQGLLDLVAPLTPWTWDDSLAKALGKVVAHKLFRRK